MRESEVTSQPAWAADAYAPPAAANPHLAMLRRVTRQLTVTRDRRAVLESITSALVEHTGAVISRVFLYLTDDECEACRAARPSSPTRSDGERRLHLCASTGIPVRPGNPAVPDHVFSIASAAPPAKVARERRPFVTNDLLRVAGDAVSPALSQLYVELGVVAAGAYPLDFHGELMGVIGMLSRQPFAPDEFELLEIFADQAAMAIKGVYLMEELERHKNRLHAENQYLQEEIRVERGFGFEHIIGRSRALRSVLRHVEQVAAVETSVLLTGETGTGKELVARAIHDGSPRKERPLIKVNCGAIPQGVVESELFGHEKGAFTGALQKRVGRFELADKGTLFMDEVGELPPDTQVKLLRVLQEREFERVGSTKAIKVDVRLVAATNRDLEKEVAEGRFRADLFYRLNVFPIRIPPLRERPEDIPLLVEYFLAHFQRKLAKPLKRVTPATMDQLRRYAWPGNVRELQNVLERACVLAQGPEVELVGTLQSAPGRGPALAAEAPIPTLVEHERMQIRRALAAVKGRVHGPRGAAALLGVNPSTLRSRMQKLGISTRT
jgi:formate hydrogenlyase transcriptional activator